MKLIVRFFIIFLLFKCILWSGELNRLEDDIKKLYSTISPSIVTVHFGSREDSDFIGTGIVIDNKGNIVTIKRFLSDENIWIETVEGEKFDAKLIGSDSETGIAVIRVKKALKPSKLCNLEELVPGDFLFVVGNSFGLKNGISISIFSGKRNGDNYLQLGNAVLPGNSGGGVFNTKGELVGIVSFALRTSLFYGAPEIKSELRKKFRIMISPKMELSSASDGPGVVIPCERMLDLANEIIVYGKIERGWLGVFIKEVDGKIVVSGLVDDGPARIAGIEKDDVILKYNKEGSGNLSSFIKKVKDTKPGTKVRVTVKRGKKEKDIDVEIGERKDEERTYRFKEIIPPLEFFNEKEELRNLKEEVEKLKEELKKQKENN